MSAGVSHGSQAARLVDRIATIGSDRALTPQEIGDGGDPDVPAVARAWRLYDEHWRRFCGTRLDPQFWKLDLPVTRVGRLALSPGATVVVVGTGPSLRAGLDDLTRVRDRVLVFTSPRGAAALGQAGLFADLVLVEHQTALDAHLSVRDIEHGSGQRLARSPLVCCDARSPAALVAGVAPERCFVPDRLPTVGLWPATLVALALSGGARDVRLLGIDLGTPDQPDPVHAPLRDTLALLADAREVRYVDAGTGAHKAGWMRHAVAQDVGAVHPSLDVSTVREWTIEERVAAADAARHRLEACAAEARRGLALAWQVRDGDRCGPTVRSLVESLVTLLQLADNRQSREDIQEWLGAEFLPRLWRTTPDLTLGRRLWRPLALAAHELVAQHRALCRRLALNDSRPTPGHGA